MQTVGLQSAFRNFPTVGIILSCRLQTAACSGGRPFMSRWNLIWLLGILGTYLVGFSLNAFPPQGGAKNKHEDIRLLVDVLEEVDNKYVKQLDDGQRRELVENMINGGLEKLDPH